MAVDVNRFRVDGLYEARGPVANLLQDLNQIQGLAAVWRAARKRLATWASFLFVLGFASFFIFFPMGLVMAGVGIWCLYRMKVYPKGIVSHEEWCAFAKSVAAILESDGDPKQPVSMRLALNAPEQTISAGALPGRARGTERLYKLAWFSVEATLCDGTNFTQSIEDMVRHRAYRNSRGKSKSKTRTRSIVSMRFDYPAETYGDITPLEEKMKSEIHMPQSSSLRGLEVTGKAVKLKALVGEPNRHGLLAETSSIMALGVYRMLNFSRTRRGAAR